MAERKTINPLLDDPGFGRSSVARALTSRPLGFIDVGARGGVDPMMADAAALTGVLAFEPDPEACAALEREARQPGPAALPWASLTVKPVALSGRGGRRILHRLSAPTNDSLLPPNPLITRRYAMAK